MANEGVKASEIVPSSIGVLMTIISAIALQHSRKHLPASSQYARYVKISLSFNTATAIFETVFLSYFASFFPEIILLLGLTLINVLFTCTATAFVFAQSDFLHTIAPANEISAMRLVKATRIFGIVTGIVGFLTSFYVFLSEDIMHLIYNLHTLTVMLVTIFDIFLNAYLVRYAHKNFSRSRWEYRAMLIAVWLFCFMIFVGVSAALAVGGPASAIISGTAVVIALIYMPLSYMIIAIVKLMLVRQSLPSSMASTEAASKTKSTVISSQKQSTQNTGKDIGSVPDGSRLAVKGASTQDPDETGRDTQNN